MHRFFFLFLWIGSITAEDKPIVGLGDMACDFLAHVDEDFVAKCSVRKGEGAPRDPEAFHRVLNSLPSSYVQIPGGSAANTIRLLALLGEKTAFATAIGTDPLSEELAAHLSALHIQRRGIQAPDRGVLKVLCLITPDADRTFLTCFPGSSKTIPDMQEQDWKDSKWLHMEMWAIRRGWDLESAMQKAKSHNIPISLCLASAELINLYRDPLLHLIAEYVQIAFCNEEEAFALVGAKGEESCYKLQELCPIAVVTLGEKGAFIGSQGKVIFVPAFPVQPIDTTGAGDVFAGGFLYAYLRGAPLDLCAKAGHRTASAVVQVVGPQLHADQIPDLREFLRKEGLDIPKQPEESGIWQGGSSEF